VLLPIIPAIVFTLFALYVPSFISGYLNEPKYNLVDRVDVVVTDVLKPNGAKSNGKLKVENGQPSASDIQNGDMVTESVEVQETLEIQDRPAHPIRKLLSGAPNPRSLLLSALTFLVNAALVGFVADRLFRERYYTGEDLSFVRPGFISEDTAKFLIREPDQSKMPVTIEVRLKDPHPPFDNPVWEKAGGIRWTTNNTDYTAVVNVPLRHTKQRTWEWRSTNNHSGEFTTAPRVGSALETTDGPFTFLSTSCIVNRLPYSPFDHPLAIPGLRYLAKVLPTLNAQFMLFLGDFIYADVPRWWGKGVEDYRQKYRQVYASPDWPAVGQNLSWIHTLDDHEIYNDWSANTTGIYTTAVDPWRHYHAAANPPVAKKAGSSWSARPDAIYYEFTQGPASFFLLDTRTHRSSNDLPATDDDKTMLGPDQLADLLAFLKRPEPKGVKWKIVASSVPFTKNWRVNTKDTWGGFLAERQRILEAMWDAGTRGTGVVVLSGDRHEFAATKFPPPDGGRWPAGATVWEFSCSPLSQFYSPIPTYQQTDGDDVLVKYIHRGNSKFGAITIENLEQGDQSSLKYRLYVNGEEVWNTVVLSTPRTSDTSSFWNRLRSSV